VEIVLNVGGKRHSTLLSTLLASPGSRIHAMFAPMLQGAPASFARSFTGRGQGAGGGRGPGLPAEGVPHYQPPAGPLPRSKDGAYVLDRDGTSFGYILDFLRSGEAVVPRDAEQRARLAKEARYYGLDELADACSCLVRVMAAASGVGHTVAEVLALTDAERKMVCEEQGIGLLERKRMEAEVQLRQKLGTVLSEAGLCALVAAGQTVDTLSSLDATSAAQLGLNEDDARTIGEGDAGLELRRALAGHYSGAMKLSDGAVRLIVGARLTLAEVRQLDGAAALELGLSAEDVRKVLWEFVFEGVDNSVADHGKFDQAGVLNHIGTAGGKRAWVNPCSSGDVSVEWSSVRSGSAEQFVSKWDWKVVPKGEGPYTNDQPNSWMRVDLGATRSLVVRHYALRKDSHHSHTLRNWELQGANAADGPWTMLRRHDNDASIGNGKPGYVAAWPVEGVAAFRFFRIHQHGQNTSESSERDSPSRTRRTMPSIRCQSRS